MCPQVSSTDYSADTAVTRDELQLQFSHADLIQKLCSHVSVVKGIQWLDDVNQSDPRKTGYQLCDLTSTTAMRQHCERSISPPARGYQNLIATTTVSSPLQSALPTRPQTPTDNDS